MTVHIFYKIIFKLVLVVVCFIVCHLLMRILILVIFFYPKLTEQGGDTLLYCYLTFYW